VNALRIDFGLTFWAVVTFGCVFLLLARFVFKPLQRILKEREEGVQQSLDAAETARREAAELLEMNQAQLDAAREETRRIIDEGQRIATRMKQEAEERAQEESRHLVDQARSEIDKEVQQGLDSLKSTVAGLAVRISRQVMKEELDEDRHTQLANEFVERLKKTHAKHPS
jgi:F-type H+-transporting ATPase subunit b